MKERHIKCEKCKGTGWVSRGKGVRGLRECSFCNGKGEIIEIPCFTDDAEGTVGATK